jgi:RNA polymerase sigma-54 factor
MAIEFRQNLRQSQSLLLSPQIQQAIKILTLGRTELQEFVSEELKENPCLEESQSKTESYDSSDEHVGVGHSLNTEAFGGQTFDSSPNSLVPSGESEPNLADLGEALIAAVSGTLGHDGHSTGTMDHDGSSFDVPMYDNMRSSGSNLHDELEDQLRMMHLTDHERQCALTVLQYVDDDGYVTTSLDEIAQENGLETDDCLSGLEIVQRCEPTGVGARNVQECLLLQLRAQPEIPALAERIIKDFWQELQKVDVQRIARALRVDLDDVKDTVRLIRSELDPRPARQFGDHLSQVIEPDVYVFQRNGQWVVSLNEDGLPRLRISKHYEKLVGQLVGGRKGSESQEAKSFINTRIKSAKWLVRALAERNKTILRVTEVVVAKQSGFLDRGVDGLRPLTLRQVADELGLHESTVSRTTTNKYVQTPQGLFELKYFFNSAMTGHSGEQLASETIRVWVADMIKAENPSKPLSDQEIANTIAASKNVPVARRTIAKYREALGIPPSSQRVRKF